MESNKLESSDKLIIGLLLCLVGFLVDILIPKGISGGLLQIPGLLVSLRSKRKYDGWFCMVFGLCFATLGFIYSPPALESVESLLLNRLLTLLALVVISFMGSGISSLNKDKEALFQELIRAREDAIQILKTTDRAPSKVKKLSDVLDTAEKILDKKGSSRKK